MDVKEAERVVVAKPVASRPTWPTFRSFSELLAGAINTPPIIESPQTTVSAIRPKTVRFKPAVNRSPSEANVSGAALSNSSQKNDEPDTKQCVLYKPRAKLVSKATVSLLANMGNYSTNRQHARESMEAGLQSSNLHQRYIPPAETNQTSESFKMVPKNAEEDQKTSPSTSNAVDRPSYDGYNWRKYGQKQVKGSEYPRSYYKCTYPNCPVKKKVERSYDGQIAEIVYKGEHNHSKSQPPKRNSGAGILMSDGMGQDAKNHLLSSHHAERNEAGIENQNDTVHVKVPVPNDSARMGAINAAGGSTENSCGQSGECEDGSKGFEVEEDEPRNKRRKNENQFNEAAVSEEGLVEPRVVVQSSTYSEILGDGFRWRKYGQKVVKGNSHPRSYYRCTSFKCNARKHVERSIDDPRAFITTYEGKHNHDMPRKTSVVVASEDKP